MLLLTFRCNVSLVRNASTAGSRRSEILVLQCSNRNLSTQWQYVCSVLIAYLLIRRTEDKCLRLSLWLSGRSSEKTGIDGERPLVSLARVAWLYSIDCALALRSFQGMSDAQGTRAAFSKRMWTASMYCDCCQAFLNFFGLSLYRCERTESADKSVMRCPLKQLRKAFVCKTYQRCAPLLMLESQSAFR